jgi:hypothetical protein
MKKEKIILSFIAVAVGLIIAGGAYYFYQSSKILPNFKQQTTNVRKPTPMPQDTISLSVSVPLDEAVVTQKVVTISGKTISDATIIILTENDQQVIKPTAVGTFSTTVNIEDGQNIIKITAVSKSGEQETVLKTITFSTEEF